MRKLYLLFLVVLTASCSPRVITRISTPLAPLDAADDVTVIHEGGIQPQNSLFIGTVEVTDSGVSVECSYDEVVSIARLTTARAGGNYLRIDSHRWPDFISTCHRIAGTMYFVGNPVASVPTSPVASDASPEPTDEQPHLRQISDDELIRQTAPTTRTTPVVEPVVQPAAQPVAVQEPERKLSRWRFALDVGYSYRTAKFAGTPVGMTAAQWMEFTNGLKNGITYGASITPFFNRWIGIGAKFAGNHYSSNKYGFGDKIGTYYIGPELFFRVPSRNLNNMWIFTLSAGYVAYRETISIGSASANVRAGGFKSTSEIGFDFRLAGKLFMGFKIAANVGFVDASVNGNVYRESLNALEIGGGIRF